ncbi:MAG: flagellar biosynthesis protein FlgD [Bdellovibrionaceae bacterium]|nr:flagellar biosynthesis protein FlgD [Pseudobdellovibrionaceae bacterium]
MGTMGVKLGTKAFGVSPEKQTGTANLPSNISATDKDKIGGENVGDVLNKIADSNWVDPSKKMRTAGNDKLDKDAFFRLMLAQMKNQDPTNPLKPHEMSAQLANFSALEQMQNMNTTLTEMKNGQKPTEQFQALNLLGKAVSGDSARVVRMKGDKFHDFNFNLPKNGDVTLKVRDAAGEIVRTYDLKNLKEGSNKISWNGLDERGLPSSAGEYAFIVEAKDAAGQKLHVKTDFEGTITGVNYTPEGPVLLIGNQTVRLSDVKKIVDPSLMKNDQISKSVPLQDLKNMNGAQQTENVQTQGSSPSAGNTDDPAPAGEALGSNLLSDVGLSREMMSRLSKETGQGG